MERELLFAIIERNRTLASRDNYSMANLTMNKAGGILAKVLEEQVMYNP